MHAFLFPLPYVKEATNYRTGQGLMHSFINELSAIDLP